MLELLVRKDDLGVCEVVEAPATAPSAGEVLVRVDRFACTANNITYAVMGDAMSYWRFFPAREGWGHVPAWGFAEVVATGRDDVAVGERFFGFLPMTSHALLRPGAVSAQGFAEGSPHRAGLPSVYNRYRRRPSGPRGRGRSARRRAGRGDATLAGQTRPDEAHILSLLGAKNGDRRAILCAARIARRRLSRC